MKYFVYSGRNDQGSPMNGVLEANDEKDAANQLLGQGIIPTEIVETNAIRGKASKNLNNLEGNAFQKFFAPKITIIDVMLFSRQMNTLLRSGVPILKALTGLQESTQNVSFKSVVQDIRTNLDSGRELSAGMAKHPKVFSHFYISMVKVGELSGMLEQIFLQMYEHLEFEKKMGERIRSALRYPSFVITAVLMAMVVINIFVIPAFSKVYDSFKVELPLMTRILIATSKFMISYWHLLLGATILLIVAIQYYLHTPRGKYQWDRYKLSLPIAGKIIRKATLARFARSFSLAISSGVPIINSLNVVSQVVDNVYVGEKVLKMREGIERGDSILKTSHHAEIFTPIVLQMIAVGEETGAIDELMFQVSQLYQEEVEYELKTLSEQIEPILIVIIGIMILVLALGVFLPVWDLASAAMKH